MRHALLVLVSLIACKPAPAAKVDLPSASSETLEEWNSIIRGMRMDQVDTAGTKLKERQTVQDLRSTTGPTVIALWATYCPPCIEEMPMFDALHSDGHRVLGVSMDESLGDVGSVLTERSPRYPQAVLQGWSMRKVGRFLENGLPFTIVLDRKGNVRYLFKGKTNEAQIRAALERLQSKV